MPKLKIEPMKEPDRIINYWKREPFVVFCIVLSGLLYNGMLVLGPIFQGKMIDAIAGGKPLRRVAALCLIYLCVIGFIQLIRYFKRFYIRRFANSASAVMRRMIYNNIMNRTAPQLDQENTGNLMTRAISDVKLCVEGMRKFTTEIFDTGVLMVSYLVMMLSYDWKLTLIACVFTPLSMQLGRMLKKVVFRYSLEFREKSSQVTDLIYDRIKNALLYRVSGMEETNQEEYNRELEELQNKAVKANVLENSMTSVYRAISMLGIVAVIVLGGHQVLQGRWTVGNFSAYTVMFLSVTNKAGRAAKLLNSVQKSQVSWRRIQPYLGEYRQKDQDEAEKVDRESQARVVHSRKGGNQSPQRASKRLRGLEVRELRFTYPETNRPVISSLSFSAKPGEIIGVTGPIACGKSTLGLALTGLYPYEGSILLEGRELSDFTEVQRSRKIASLHHNPYLLSDTIYENITLGEGGDISELLRDVRFEEDLAAMKEGQQTLIGSGGVRLSGGQQARIALARTLYGHKPLILLDDPFSAVDMKTEEEIICRIRSSYSDSVILLISHRLSIFDRVDRILFFHENGDWEQGTHRELLRRSALYREIVSLQQGEECPKQGQCPEQPVCLKQSEWTEQGECSEQIECSKQGEGGRDYDE